MTASQRIGIIGAVVCESDAETDAARWGMTRSSSTRKKAQTAAQRAYGGRRTAQGGEVDASTVITFLVPLPPPALRGNSRSHWTERKRAADEYSEAVCAHCAVPAFRGKPWDRAAVEYEWRYAGARPDLDNVARAVKVLQDTLCCCPADFARRLLGDAYEGRYFLGLIEDDGGIEPVTFKRRKVATKAEEGVHVTIERVEG